MRTAFFGYRIDSGKEAISKQFILIAKKIKSDIVSFNDNIIKYNNKNINLPRNYFLKKIAVLYNWKKFEQEFDLIFFHSDPNSILFRLIKKRKYVHFITKDFEEKLFKKYLRFAHRFKLIIVENKNLFDRLKSNGINNIIHIYPFCEKFKICKKKEKEFILLFFSSPLGKSKEEKYISKGVRILLKAFEKFGKGKLIILWRDSCLGYLSEDISSNTRKEDIILINQKVDIKKYLAKSDCVVIPYKTKLQSPDYPLSAIEALISKKPIICSDIVEISSLIKKEGCGVTFEPSIDNLKNAMDVCFKNNKNMSSKCHSTFKKYFSCKENVDKIKKALIT
jgi:glycosyltransferase involved in cell wall biosynthesis